jgi:predicted ArsR family transcriptional regulator
MESTREQVLHLLQMRGGATVAVLAQALGLGQASVRRHLDHLRAEGLADVRIERHGVGRPAFIFYPTAEAEDRTPAGYSRLIARVYRGLSALDASQVRGRDGEALMDAVFEGVAQDIAREHLPEVVASTTGARVEQASLSLKREGIVDGWEQRDDGYHLTNSACPYRQAALANHGTCELDRRTIELLVNAPVRQVRRIADGEFSCEYIVRKPGTGNKEHGR